MDVQGVSLEQSGTNGAQHIGDFDPNTENIEQNLKVCFYVVELIKI